MTHKILIIDDEADIRDVLADIFQDEGYSVFKAAHSEQAFAYVEKERPDLIVLDIWLENSDMDGMEILKELNKNTDNFCPVLMISGHGNIEMAVKAMKFGAYDFIEKPFKIDHMLLTVERALEQNLLKRENAALKSKSETASGYYKTQSPKMAALLKAIDETAATDARILILGERGSGKSRLARYIHQNSQRSRNSFASHFGCDLSANDIGDLFTDDNLKSGTVFIEQIQTMDKPAQIALLAVLNKTNSHQTPRLITTALSNIHELIEEGRFSSALYNRLSVMEFSLPALDQRAEDFPAFIHDFSKAICQELNIPQPAFSSDAIIAIQNFKWAGNIRQLKSAIEWLIICHAMTEQRTASPIITAKDLFFIISETGQVAKSEPSAGSPVKAVEISGFRDLGNWLDMPLRDAREAFEKKYLSMLLKRFNGNISQMAAHIDMERTALHRKLKIMDLRLEETGHDKTTVPFAKMAEQKG